MWKLWKLPMALPDLLCSCQDSWNSITNSNRSLLLLHELPACSHRLRGWEPSGFLLLLWEAEVGRQHRWNAEGVQDLGAAGIASAFVTSLSPDTSLLVLWFLTRKLPWSWLTLQQSTSPNPSTNCISAENSLLHFTFFLLWKQSTIFSSQMWWVL